MTAFRKRGDETLRESTGFGPAKLPEFMDAKPTSGSKGRGYPPELLEVKDVAAILSCGERTVYRHADAGRIPRPIKLGTHLIRWRRSELFAWIDDGCPPIRRPKGGGK